MDIQYLREQLKLATFDGTDYFSSLMEGCYEVSSEVFSGIKSHPSLLQSYLRKIALQQGESTKNIDPLKYATCFKSVSRYHLEFDSGVVVVRGVNSQQAAKAIVCDEALSSLHSERNDY
jgi:hypothetical protein